MRGCARARVAQRCSVCARGGNGAISLWGFGPAPTIARPAIEGARDKVASGDRSAMSQTLSEADSRDSWFGGESVDHAARKASLTGGKGAACYGDAASFSAGVNRLIDRRRAV